ncbi:MAG: hypothetical protein FD143_596 [Ignavibacteria bacterium]|nr:MAG: hypothetical protein FD143_596 [Ignavibacteria bacterium]KAF0161667.1 MAG: hypothetical protein FD188_784 [Ignavibacteria bacterium]
MKKVLFILLAYLSIATTAQTADTTKSQWVPSFVTSLGLNQIAFSNWVKGGESSIAWTVMGNFHYDKISTTEWSFKNSIKAAYGRTKIGSGVYRTTDNDLYLENVASYNLGWAVSPFISNSIRTQLASGFDYNAAPEKEIANFFDPGYITQTIGFTYDKYQNVVTRLGLGFQEIITNKFTQYSDDPTTKNVVEKFRIETGIESVTDADIKLDDNIIYKSKLRLFSQFKSLDVWDVRWDNIIAAKITKYISVNFSFLLIYEKAQTLRTQIKEGLQVGFVYTVF